VREMGRLTSDSEEGRGWFGFVGKKLTITCLKSYFILQNFF